MVENQTPNTFVVSITWLDGAQRMRSETYTARTEPQEAFGHSGGTYAAEVLERLENDVRIAHVKQTRS